MTNTQQTATTTLGTTSEKALQWLRDRTYHAQLLDGTWVPFRQFTETMGKYMSQGPVPIPSWVEITREEARARHEAGEPLLCYGEEPWTVPSGGSGTDIGVCYYAEGTTNANANWPKFSSGMVQTLFGKGRQTVRFFKPAVIFSYEKRYAVICDGVVYNCANWDEQHERWRSLPSCVQHRYGTTVFPAAQNFWTYYVVQALGETYCLTTSGPGAYEPAYRIRDLSAVQGHRVERLRGRYLNNPDEAHFIVFNTEAGPCYSVLNGVRQPLPERTLVLRHPDRETLLYVGILEQARYFLVHRQPEEVFWLTVQEEACNGALNSGSYMVPGSEDLGQDRVI